MAVSARSNRGLWGGQLEAIGLNKYLHMWCDIEEQGTLDEKVASELREKKALRVIQMALARTRLLEPLSPLEIQAVDAAVVVGGGIAGLQMALSLAELGKRVHLVERESGVGGKVASLHRFYPRLCDPLCGLQFTLERLRASDRVQFHTLSRVESIEGGPGRFQVRISQRPRYVDLHRCNGCGECVDACPVEVSRPLEDSAFNSRSPLDGTTRKAIGPASPMPFPTAFVVERELCPTGSAECEKACPAAAVNLAEAPTHLDVQAGAVFVTTGWDPYPLSKVEEFGYGLYPGVITNLQMERFLGSELPPLEAPPLLFHSVLLGHLEADPLLERSDATCPMLRVLSGYPFPRFSRGPVSGGQGIGGGHLHPRDPLHGEAGWGFR